MGQVRRQRLRPASTRLEFIDMLATVHDFDWPDRTVVGTVGPPGSRTFYLQVRLGRKMMSVALEKEQSALLADKIDELLNELMAQDDNVFNVPSDVPPELIDSAPLEQPVDEEFRARSMVLRWDPTTAVVVIEAYPFADPDEGDFVAESLNMKGIRARLPVGAARAFARRTHQVVREGRPICPMCGQPMDPQGHICTPPEDS